LSDNRALKRVQGDIPEQFRLPDQCLCHRGTLADLPVGHRQLPAGDYTVGRPLVCRKKCDIIYALVMMADFAVLSHQQRCVGAQLSQSQNHDEDMSHILQDTARPQISVESESSLLLD
jgi:hypothetical protein